LVSRLQTPARNSFSFWYTCQYALPFRVSSSLFFHPDGTPMARSSGRREESPFYESLDRSDFLHARSGGVSSRVLRETGGVYFEFSKRRETRQGHRLAQACPILTVNLLHPRNRVFQHSRIVSVAEASLRQQMPGETG